MGKRVGLLAGLLVLVLGAGVVAQEPEATSLFAPDELEFTLPSTVGDCELDIATVDSLDPAYRDMWRDLLLPLGKEPKDVRQVNGAAYPLGQAHGESDEPTFRLGAVRVERVPAVDLVEPALAVAFETAGTASGVMQSEWRVIDGRDVYGTTFAPPDVLMQTYLEMAAEQGLELMEEELADIRAFQPSNPESGVHFYPKGEVLYGIIMPIVEVPDNVPSVAEILAALP